MGGSWLIRSPSTMCLSWILIQHGWATLPDTAWMSFITWYVMDELHYLIQHGWASLPNSMDKLHYLTLWRSFIIWHGGASLYDNMEELHYLTQHGWASIPDSMWMSFHTWHSMDELPYMTACGWASIPDSMWMSFHTWQCVDELHYLTACGWACDIPVTVSVRLPVHQRVNRDALLVGDPDSDSEAGIWTWCFSAWSPCVGLTTPCLDMGHTDQATYTVCGVSHITASHSKHPCHHVHTQSHVVH